MFVYKRILNTCVFFRSFVRSCGWWLIALFLLLWLLFCDFTCSPYRIMSVSIDGWSILFLLLHGSALVWYKKFRLLTDYVNFHMKVGLEFDKYKSLKLLVRIFKKKKYNKKKWIAMNTSFIKNAFTMLYVLKCSGFPASYF